MAGTVQPPAAAPSDREKWEAERAFRERELALAELDARIKSEELELRRREQRHAHWRNPLLIAIGAAAVAGFANIYVASTNGAQNRYLEDRKSEQVRILEMIKTGDPDSAAKNLEFLLDAGLIADPDRKAALQAYLKSRPEGGGVSLPSETSSVGGIVGIDDTVPAASLPQSAPLAALTQAVGRLSVRMGGQSFECTAVAIGQDRVLTAGFCVRPERTSAEPVRMAFLLTPTDSLPATLGVADVDGVNGQSAYAIVNVPGLDRRVPRTLALATAAPQANQPLSMILYRNGEARVTTGAADCRVLAVSDTSFSHGCDTGPGSSGSPLLNARNEIVGVHLMAGRNLPGTAARGDWVARRLAAPR